MAKASPHARAFTLIEILVVMGIIVLLVALALPAFNFITGNRSTEAAGNQIAAALGIARSQAIGIQETKGVVIYHDRDSDKSVAALVELKQSPFDLWVAGSAVGTSPGPTLHPRGQYMRYSNKLYACIDTYTDITGTAKPDDSNSAYWRELKSLQPFAAANAPTATFVDVQAGGEFVTLPTGVEARAVGNQTRFPSPASPLTSANSAYRYFNPAVILFDANGQVVTSDFYIAQEGLLGSECDLTDTSKYASPPSYNPMPGMPATVTPYGAPNPIVAGSAQYAVSSQIGLVLYNGDQFRNTVGAAGADVQANWLDENGTPLMINRFNGTLVRGE